MILLVDLEGAKNLTRSNKRFVKSENAFVSSTRGVLHFLQSLYVQFYNHFLNRCNHRELSPRKRLQRGKGRRRITLATAAGGAIAAAAATGRSTNHSEAVATAIRIADRLFSESQPRRSRSQSERRIWSCDGIIQVQMRIQIECIPRDRLASSVM